MKPVVLLHGWGCVPEVWQNLIALMPQQEFINLALPGYNNSGNWQTPAQYIAEQLPAQCHLVGWSLGGNLAMEIAVKYPEKIASVATIATTPCFVASENWPQAMQRQIFEAFSNSVQASPAATLKRFVALQAKGAENERELLKAMRKLALSVSSGASVLSDSLRWLGQCKQQALWKSLATPKQHIFCGGDALVPVSAAEYCANSVVLSNAGHAPMLSKPKELSAMLVSFWAGLA